MYSFALTGGIATGKTTFARFLLERCPSAVVFDCDKVVSRLLNDQLIQAKIVSALGESVVDGVSGNLSRTALREEVFSNKCSRTTLEEILHPLTREECLESLAETATSDRSSLFIADVPLLFESGFDFGYESSLLVATTRETQLERLKSRDGHDDALAEAMLDAQLPISEKVDRADVVFWNEGPEQVLRCQILRFLETLDILN